VAAAKAAFKGPWKKFTGAQRAACMNKLADLIEENIDELARLESIAMGQPIGVAKAFIGLAIPGWRCEYVSPTIYTADTFRLRWLG
jgi:aldehyde dehydrogenase (NAD+)